MTVEEYKPKMSIRCTTVFGWFIPIFIVFSYFNYRENIPLDIRILFVISLISVGLLVPELLRIIKLQRKVESKFVTVMTGLLAAVAVIVLLELKQRGIFVWNELYVTVPISLASVVLYLACFLAEDRNFVKVYLALDGYHYVSLR